MPRGKNRGRRTRRNAKNTQISRSIVKQDENEAVKIEDTSSSARKNIEKRPAFMKKSELINNVSQSNNCKTMENSSKEKSRTKKNSPQRNNRPENRSFVSRICWCNTGSNPNKYLVETSGDKKSNMSKVSKTETGNEIKLETSNRRQSNDNQDVRKFSFLTKKKTSHGKVDIYSTDKLDEAEDARITCEAVELLKHVKNVTKEKERKNTSSGKHGFLTRVRRFFRN